MQECLGDEVKRRITRMALAVAVLALSAPLVAVAEEVEGRTELHMAVLHRDVNKVRVLLADGAFANTADSNGRTALHYAVVPDPLGVDRSYLLVSALLAHNADSSIEDKTGHAPIDLAVAIGSASVLDVLFKHGANPSRVGPTRLSLLSTAQLNGRDDLALVIEQYGGERGTSDYEQSILPSMERSGEFMRSVRARLEIAGGGLENASGIVREELFTRFPEMSEEQVEDFVSKMESVMTRPEGSCQSCAVK